jgi:hypothetical protein
VKDEIEKRFKRNLKRVESLSAVYEKHSGGGQGRRSVEAADTLRAATVFLHATLEDLVRSVEEWKLPECDEDCLNGIALAGATPHSEKFALGKLAAHRGSTVDSLIAASVRDHLAQKSYNDVETIASALQRVGVALDAARPSFSTLSTLIARRHNIVHRTDRDDTAGKGHHGTKSIGRQALLAWIAAVRSFGDAVLKQL